VRLPWRRSACNQHAPVRLLSLALPTELADGRYPAPAWAILGLGGVVVAGAAVYLGVLWSRRARKRALDLRGPKEKR